jgi:hypothetical protein
MTDAGDRSSRPDFSKARLQCGELEMLKAVYAETYPVRVLMNEVEELRLFLADEKEVRRGAEARIRELEASLDGRPGTALDLKSIWEQACAGLFTEHGDCPATFACSAILAEFVDAGYCANCFCLVDRCRALWKEQRKCCPECTHA